MRGLSSISSLFRNEFNKVNNTGARMIDSIYHVTKDYFEISFSNVKRDYCMTLFHVQTR